MSGPSDSPSPSRAQALLRAVLAILAEHRPGIEEGHDQAGDAALVEARQALAGGVEPSRRRASFRASSSCDFLVGWILRSEPLGQLDGTLVAAVCERQQKDLARQVRIVGIGGERALEKDRRLVQLPDVQRVAARQIVSQGEAIDAIGLGRRDR